MGRRRGREVSLSRGHGGTLNRAPRTMAGQPVRVAVVGLGFMGGMHVAALQSIPSAQLVAVYSRDERKLSGDLSAVGGNLSGAGGVYDFSSLKKYRELEDVLNDPEIDALDICL